MAVVSVVGVVAVLAVVSVVSVVAVVPVAGVVPVPVVKSNVCSCKSSSRWIKFSNFQRNFTNTYVHTLTL